MFFSETWSHHPPRYKLLGLFKRMYEQKMKEHIKAYENQQKQMQALKKSGKSAKQAEEELKRNMQNKQNKQTKGKKGSSSMGDEGWLTVFSYSYPF